MKTEKNHFGCSIHGVDANTATPAVIAELKALQMPQRQAAMRLTKPMILRKDKNKKLPKA